MTQIENIEFPGLDCGLCGYRTCGELEGRLVQSPELLKRCIHLSQDRAPVQSKFVQPVSQKIEVREHSSNDVCNSCLTQNKFSNGKEKFIDSLGRDFDFYLEHFPEDPGPREIIIPHNPMITREMDVQVGDILIGRPLGMSCGCPITHCGVAINVDKRTGVIVWCVTGPLQPRQNGFKDLGYYIAEGYEGIIKQARCEIKIGMRYFFQPHMCMLQWRHSGLVNYLNRTNNVLQVRVEGLWIG